MVYGRQRIILGERNSQRLGTKIPFSHTGVGNPYSEWFFSLFFVVVSWKRSNCWYAAVTSMLRAQGAACCPGAGLLELPRCPRLLSCISVAVLSTAPELLASATPAVPPPAELPTLLPLVLVLLTLPSLLQFVVVGLVGLLLGCGCAGGALWVATNAAAAAAVVNWKRLRGRGYERRHLGGAQSDMAGPGVASQRSLHPRQAKSVSEQIQGSHSSSRVLNVMRKQGCEKKKGNTQEECLHASEDQNYVLKP
eukprot:596231-Pelagomonas_calceolata.AAC.1